MCFHTVALLQVIVKIQYGELPTWGALLPLNVEYLILRVYTETVTFGYLVVAELTCNKLCLANFIFARDGLAEYQKN